MKHKCVQVHVVVHVNCMVQYTLYGDSTRKKEVLEKLLHETCVSLISSLLVVSYLYIKKRNVIIR